MFVFTALFARLYVCTVVVLALYECTVFRVLRTVQAHSMRCASAAGGWGDAVRFQCKRMGDAACVQHSALQRADLRVAHYTNDRGRCSSDIHVASYTHRVQRSLL